MPACPRATGGHGAIEWVPARPHAQLVTRPAPPLHLSRQGTLVPVDPRAMFLSTLQVVLVPVMAGAAVNQWFPKVGPGAQVEEGEGEDAVPRRALL